MAQRIVCLGPELLGRVLDLLPLQDLRAARLAGSALDDASRKHTARCATLKLTPRCGPAMGWPGRPPTGRPGPNWARFPRLRRLELSDWGPKSLPSLRAAAAGCGAGALGGVKEVEALESCAPLDAPTWAAILKHAHRVSALNLGRPGRWGENENEGLAALAAVAALAPRVARLDARGWLRDAACAAVVTANLPHLTALTFDLKRDDGETHEIVWAHDSSDDEDESPAAAAARAARFEGLWAALPCTRLAHLEIQGGAPLAAPPPEALPWPRMRVLAGVTLPAARAAALARGLLGLQQLSANPEGDWAGLVLQSKAAFKSLTCLQLPPHVRGSFCCAAPLPRLFPALERLEWTGGCDEDISCDIPALSRLTHLTLTDKGGDWVRLGSAVWDRMHRLRRLREAVLQLAFGELPLLARLPLSVTLLDAQVALRRDEGEREFVWAPLDDDDEGPPLNACEVLAAAARYPRLRKLRLQVTAAADLNHAALARLVRGGALASLEELELRHPRVQLHDVSVLATLPRLRRLAVSPVDCDEWASDPAAQRLVAEHTAEGLEIAVI